MHHGQRLYGIGSISEIWHQTVDGIHKHTVLVYFTLHHMKNEHLNLININNVRYIFCIRVKFV